MSRLRVDRITNNSANGAVDFPNGITATGNLNITGDITATNVSVGGTLTYEDVANVNSVGLITARRGIFIGGNPSAPTDGTLVVGDNTGIGIGTDNPDCPLDVRGTSTLPAQFVSTSSNSTVRIRKQNNTLTDNTSLGSLQFSGTHSPLFDDNIKLFANIEARILVATDSAETGALDFQTASGGGATTKFSIDDTTCTFSAGLVEKFEKAGVTLGSQPNNPISDGNIILFDGNESGSLTINFTGVHAKLVQGETCSFTVILTPNNSGYINTVNVDGQTSIPIQWANGAPSGGGSSGRDVYTFQILKDGSGTSDYLILGAVQNYS